MILPLCFQVFYQREKEINVYREIFMQRFIETLFVIANNWQHTKYPSISDWINNLWYSHTMEYYQK